MYQKLIELLRVPHGSAGLPQEHNVRNYIKRHIPNINEDAHGNLYLINKWTPLFCAHMDNVWSTEAQKHLHKVSMVNNIIKWTHNIWADDKVGIFIAMEMYRRFGDKVSLLFTIGEETWGIGASAFDKSLLDNTYCVIPDRYGPSDIISSDNEYCTKEFEDLIVWVLSQFWFKAAMWIRCDADILQSHINCINISCGYYKHHSDEEYINRAMTSNTIKALDHLVTQNLPKMTPPKAGYYAGGKVSSYYGGGRDEYEFPKNKSMRTTCWWILYDEFTGASIELPPGNWELFEYTDDTYEEVLEEEDMNPIYSFFGK